MLMAPTFTPPPCRAKVHDEDGERNDAGAVARVHQVSPRITE
jgi:hypothetical protein